MPDVFDDEHGIGRIECPGCGNSLFAILAAFREGGPCPKCGLPADVARQVHEAQRRGADESLRQMYTEAMKRALDAEQERDDLRERIRELREVVNRPWKPL